MSGQVENRSTGTTATQTQTQPSNQTGKNQKVNKPSIGKRLKKFGREVGQAQIDRAKQQKNDFDEMKTRLDNEPNWLKKAGIVFGYMIRTNTEYTDPYNSNIAQAGFGYY